MKKETKYVTLYGLLPLVIGIILVLNIIGEFNLQSKRLGIWTLYMSIYIFYLAILAYYKNFVIAYGYEFVYNKRQVKEYNIAFVILGFILLLLGVFFIIFY